MRVDHQLTDRHKLFVRFSRHSNHEDRPSTFPALGATELWGPAFNLAGSLTSNFGSSFVHELRISRMYGEYRSTAYFQGQGGRPADAGRRAGTGAGAGSGDLQPAGLLLLGLCRVLGERRRWPSEVAEPRRVGDHRQPDVDQGAAHPQVRRQGLPPQDPVHRRARSQRHVRLHRGDDAEPGVGDWNGRRLRRFSARLSRQLHAIESGDLVGRIWHLLAWLPPGRFQGRRTR